MQKKKIGLILLGFMIFAFLAKFNSLLAENIFKGIKTNGREFWYEVRNWDGNFSFVQLDHKSTLLNEKDMSLLLVPLIIAESSFNPRAVNLTSGTRGLTQITHSAWNDLVRVYPGKYSQLVYERDIFKLDIGRMAGLDYLNIILNYLRAYKLQTSLENILAAYNWGIGNLVKYGWQNAPQETQVYIKRIRAMLYRSP